MLTWATLNLFVTFVLQKANADSKSFELTLTSKTSKPNLKLAAPTQAQAKAQAFVHEVVSTRGLTVANIKKRIGVSRTSGILDVLNLESEKVFPCAEAEDPNVRGKYCLSFTLSLSQFPMLTWAPTSNFVLQSLPFGQSCRTFSRPLLIGSQRALLVLELLFWLFLIQRSVKGRRIGKKSSSPTGPSALLLLLKFIVLYFLS